MKKEEVTIEELLRKLITSAINEGLYNLSAIINPPQVPDSQQSEILNVQGAAALMDLAPSTIYGLVHQGKIPHLKKGKKLRFKRTQLLEWIESGAKNPTPSSKPSVDIFTRKPSKV
jgi:excisionase family DNA binding protein